jgi:hypothetical protein
MFVTLTLALTLTRTLKLTLAPALVVALIVIATLPMTLGLKHDRKPRPACASAGLHSEALALVDMLVLIQSRNFVGFDMSTLSWCVRNSFDRSRGPRSPVCHFGIADSPALPPRRRTCFLSNQEGPTA